MASFYQKEIGWILVTDECNVEDKIGISSLTQERKLSGLQPVEITIFLSIFYNFFEFGNYHFTRSKWLKMRGNLHFYHLC